MSKSSSHSWPKSLGELGQLVRMVEEPKKSKESIQAYTGYLNQIGCFPNQLRDPLQKHGFLVRQQGCHGRIAPNPELCICSRYFACIICAKHSPRHWQVTANSQWRGNKYSKETKRKNLCNPHPQVQTQKGTLKKKTHQIALHISPHLLLIFSPAVQTGLKSLCKRACIHVEWLEFSYSHES